MHKRQLFPQSTKKRARVQRSPRTARSINKPLLDLWSQLTNEEQTQLLPELLNVMPCWKRWKDVCPSYWLKMLFEKAGLDF